jgi:LAS superfamily LD-carboxypeptidase LdcB
MNIDILQGKTTEHLTTLDGTKYLIHKQMLSDFLRLQRDAHLDGFDLQIISAFRDYDRQLKIWNSKASGERQLLDDQERPLNFSKLSPTELMFAILRWSALPGCSRHHWGTDIDVYNGRTQTPEQVQLIPSETIGLGPSARLHEWLDEKMSSDSAYGFYRPYATDRGGVSPERWHLSYYSLSRRYLEAYTFSIFKKNIEDSDLQLKAELLDNADEIYQRFFLNIDLP